MKYSQQSGAVAIMVIAGMTWGTSGTIQSFAASETSPLLWGWIRVFLGGLFLAGLCGVLGQFHGRRFASPMVWATGFATAAFQVAFFFVLRLCGVAVGTMLGIGSSLIAAGVIDICCGVKQSRVWWGAVAVALTGLVLMALPSGGSLNWWGLCLGLASGVSFALIGLGLKKMSLRGYADLERSMLILLTAGLWLLPIALLGTDMTALLSLRSLGVSLGLGLISAAVPYGLFSMALARLSVGQVYVIGLMEPVTAVLLGVLVVGERPELLALTGIALLFVALLLSSWDILRHGQDAQKSS